MFDRIVGWFNRHFYVSLTLISVIMFLLLFSIGFSLADYNRSNQLEEKAKAADFVRYTTNGETLGLDYEVIVDMDTGYQYLLFYINGDCVAVPRVDEDGSFYKTIE